MSSCRALETCLSRPDSGLRRLCDCSHPHPIIAGKRDFDVPWLVPQTSGEIVNALGQLITSNKQCRTDVACGGTTWGSIPNNFQTRFSATGSLANFAQLRALSATPKLKRNRPLKNLGHDLNIGTRVVNASLKSMWSNYFQLSVLMLGATGVLVQLKELGCDGFVLPPLNRDLLEWSPSRMWLPTERLWHQPWPPPAR